MINIAIDGPSGAGKSTVARILAQRLGIKYLDTGAMYRATALYMLENGIEISDIQAVKTAINDVKIGVDYKGGEMTVELCGRDVSAKIREHHISKAASDVSAIPEVRLKMVELQRELASQSDCVLDGRDIGTYVLPDAAVKIYLTADLEERAKRRFKELKEKGQELTFEKVLNDIAQRDKNDMNRSFAPLKKADDAYELDTTLMTAEQAADIISAEYLKLKQAL